MGCVGRSYDGRQRSEPRLYPGQEGGDSREPGWEADLAAARRTEWRHSDLLENNTSESAPKLMSVCSRVVLTSTRWPALVTTSGPPESPLQVPTAPEPLVHSVDGSTMPPKNCAHAALVSTCSATWLWNWFCEMPASATTTRAHVTWG